VIIPKLKYWNNGHCPYVGAYQDKPRKVSAGLSYAIHRDIKKRMPCGIPMICFKIALGMLAGILRVRYGLRPLPPCRVMVSPVMYSASELARNTHTRPMSFFGSAK